MSSVQPLVSIIIPTYNGARRIIKTLEAIINQDYENLEIVLVDDVSTDDTVKVSQEILEKSGRKFLIIKRTTNGRQSASRNTGLKAANGKYVIFVDHDDLMEKDFVSVLCSKIENENSDMVFCGIKNYYESENRIEEKPVTLKNKFLSSEEALNLWADEKINFWSMWNFIFRKSFLDKYKLHFTDSCYFGEDGEFILKAIVHANKISLEEKTLYIYVHYSEQTSVTSSIKNYKTYKYYAQTRRRIGRYVIKHVNDTKIKNYALSRCIAHEILKECTLCAQAGDFEAYNGVIKNFHHKKFRSIMLSTVKFIFREPELFFKSLMLVYFPNFYYYARSKHGKH